MKNLLTLLFITFSLSIFAQIDTTERVFKLPLYPFCDSLNNYENRKTCADKVMNEFIYQNFQYPKLAEENGVEGTVIISFNVEKGGSMNRYQIIRNPGAGIGEEVIRVLKMLPNLIPATINEEPISCEVSIPFRVRIP